MQNRESIETSLQSSITARIAQKTRFLETMNTLLELLKIMDYNSAKQFITELKSDDSGLGLTDEILRSKKSLEKHFKLTIQEVDREIKFLQNDDSWPLIIALASQNTTSLADINFQQLLSQINFNADIMLSIQKDAPKHTIDLENFSIDINVQHAIVQAELDILNNYVVEGDNIEKIVKEALRESLRISTKINEFISITMDIIARDYFAVDPVHIKGLLCGINTYVPFRDFFGLLCHLTHEDMMALFVVDKFEKEFQQFKIAAIDFRTSIKTIFPNLDKVEIKKLVNLVMQKRQIIIDTFEEAYIIAAELENLVAVNSCHEQYTLWKLDILSFIHAGIKLVADYQSNIYFKLSVNIHHNLKQKAISDPDFRVEKDTYMQHYLTSIEGDDYNDVIRDGNELEAVNQSKNYEVSIQGVYAACRDNQLRILQNLLAQKALQNIDLNQICGLNGRTVLIIALEKKHVQIVEFLLHRPKISIDYIRQSSRYKHLLEQPSMIVLIRSFKFQYLPQMITKPEEILKPTPVLIADEVITDEHYFEKLPTNDSCQNLIKSLYALIADIESKDEKVDGHYRQALIEFENKLAVLLKKEQTLLTSANEIKNDLQVIKKLIKSHKKLMKSFAALKQELLEQQASLRQQLEYQSEVSSNETELPPTLSAPNILAMPTNVTAVSPPAQPAAITILFKPARMDNPAEVKAGLAEDLTQLKFLHDLCKQSAFDNATLLSMQINALLFKVIQFMEKNKKLSFVGEHNIIAKNAKCIRNALVHCKGVVDEAVICPKNKVTAELELFYQHVLAFVAVLVSSYETKTYTELAQNNFYQALCQHGKVLLEQHQRHETEEITDRDRISYTQKLNRMRLRYSIAKDQCDPFLLELALNMVLSKLQIYGLHYLPKRVVSNVLAKRHFEFEPVASVNPDDSRAKLNNKH